MRPEPYLDLERDLVCIGDVRSGRFTSLNRAWEDVLGWTREQLAARPLVEFVHPEDVAATAREMALLAEPEYHVLEFDNRYLHRDGGYRWLSWTARSDGEQFLGVAFDVTERREREQRLRATLEDDRLLAYSQPIATVATRSIESHELLVRLREDDGVLEPGLFLPAAESLDLIDVVDRWMAGRAAAASARDGSLHVNLSGRTIERTEALTELERIVAEAPRPEMLVFEITETAAITNLDAARELTDRLLPYGCRFALDDFGIGYGSLTYLRSLPVAIVKIDRRFVHGLADSSEDRALVRSVIALASELGLDTVAEGVEDEATYQALEELGIDYIQGYLIGRPRPAGI